MRYVLLTLALVALFVGQAVANDGNVSKATLEKMGLSAMKTMTDADATSIRGSGFAIAWGHSTAAGGLTRSYVSTSPPAPVAAGFKISVGSGVFAGGGSIAFTK
ncbi:MAG TPA: hypothetical protein VIH42_02500 [Thermoguttaceae bacterium]